MRMRFTEEMRDWVRRHVKGCLYAALTAAFNERFGTTATLQQVRGFCLRQGLRTEMRRPQNRYTPEQTEWLEEHIAGRSFDEVAELFNRRFGANVSPRAVQSFCARHGWGNGMKGCHETQRANQFKPGHAPWNAGTRGQGVCKPNSGSFRPGNAVRSLPVGSMRFNKTRSNGAWFVKTAPNRWEPAKRVLWEQANNAEVPEGVVIINADGDKNNLSPDNLLMVSREEFTSMCKNGLRHSDADLTRAGLALAKLRLKIGKMTKKEKS